MLEGMFGDAEIWRDSVLEVEDGVMFVVVLIDLVHEKLKEAGECDCGSRNILCWSWRSSCVSPARVKNAVHGVHLRCLQHWVSMYHREKLVQRSDLTMMEK